MSDEKKINLSMNKPNFEKKVKNIEIKPYFQIELFSIDEDFDLNNLNFSKNDEDISIVENISNEIQIKYGIFKERKKPSWIKTNNEEIYNLDNILILFVKIKDLLFLNVSNKSKARYIETKLKNSEFASKLSLNKFNKLIAYFSQEKNKFKVMGLDNQSNQGENVIDSKVYATKNDTKKALSSVDSGFGLNYCYGSTEIGEYFGFSKKNNKFWKNFKEKDDFINECKEIFDFIENNNQNFQVDNSLLILNSEVDINITNNFIYFDLLNYNLERIIIIKNKNDNNEISDWYVKLDNNIISFYNDLDDSKIFEVSVNVDISKKCLIFSNISNTNYLFKINTEESEEIEIIDFLNLNEDFLLIFEFDSKFYYFKDNHIYIDNKFNSKFENKLFRNINWDLYATNIEKETIRNIESGELSIIETMVKYIEETFEKYLIIIDDGKEEIADLVVLTEDKLGDQKFIQIHCKQSKKSEPGLRIDDIYIVLSQSIKNIKFFDYEFVIDKINRLEEQFNLKNNVKYKEHNNLLNFNKGFSFDNFKDIILNLKNLSKESWVVQPGISKSQLYQNQNNDINKIHYLLNNTNSILKNKGINFKFFGNN